MPEPANPKSAPPFLELDLVLGYAPEYPNSAFIELDYGQTRLLGGKGRIPVILRVDGHEFRSSLAPMGGRHIMVFNRDMRERTGYQAGDRIHIRLERDSEPRTADIPDDVKGALEEQGVWDAFQRFSYSHKTEYLDWINEARKAETRARRITKMVETLARKRN